MLLRNAIHRTSGGSLSSFSCLQLPNYCWSYLPYSESLFINGFAGRAHRLYAPDWHWPYLVLLWFSTALCRTNPVWSKRSHLHLSPTPAGFRRLSYCTVIRPSYRQLARKHSCYSEVSGFSECPATRPDCFHRRSGKSPGCRAEWFPGNTSRPESRR